MVEGIFKGRVARVIRNSNPQGFGVTLTWGEVIPTADGGWIGTVVARSENLQTAQFAVMVGEDEVIRFA